MTLKEGTFATEFTRAKNLIVRREYRHDRSNKNTFGSVDAAPSALPGGHEKTQDTLSRGTAYLF